MNSTPLPQQRQKKIHISPLSTYTQAQTLSIAQENLVKRKWEAHIAFKGFDWGCFDPFSGPLTNITTMHVKSLGGHFTESSCCM